MAAIAWGCAALAPGYGEFGLWPSFPVETLAEPGPARPCLLLKSRCPLGVVNGPPTSTMAGIVHVTPGMGAAETAMTTRIFNFSAGPAVLPEPVLAEVQRDLMALAGRRRVDPRNQPSQQGVRRHHQAGGDQPAHAAGDSRRLRGAVPAGRRAARVLDDPDEPRCGGRAAARSTTSSPARGASTPRRKRRSSARCTPSGTARRRTTTACRSRRDLKLDPKAAYAYYVSNETIQGVEFQTRAADRQRAAGVRRVERLPEPAGRHQEVRPVSTPAPRRTPGPAGVTVVDHAQGSAARAAAIRCPAI